jgi:hypothetical protein
MVRSSRATGNFLKGEAIMARIYKTTDRIKVKIDDIIVTLAPLTFRQKQEGQSMIISGQKNGEDHAITKAVIQLIKWSLKGIAGLVDGDGNAYQLKMHNDEVSDESIDDLLNIEMYPKLMTVCTAMSVAVPSQFIGPDGKPLEGVELVTSGDKEVKDPN